MRHSGQAGEQVPDWGIGHYETTAEQLFPAARAVVESAAIRPGESVLDLGCGTGNAALLAAGHSGQVIGVDPASRLLEVARAPRNHPLAVAGLSVLEPLSQAEALRARLLEILENGNEDRDRFRVTSRYVVATACRDG